MKLHSVISLVLVAAVPRVPASPLEKRAAPQGIDVSSYQPNIDWATVKANGIAFAYIKATEGTGANIFFSLK